MNKKVLAIAFAIIIVASISVVFIVQNAESVESQRSDSIAKYRFRVEIDGIVSAAFTEAEGLNVTVEVTEYREGTEGLAPRLIPGLVRYGPLVLRRGITTNMELWNWIKNIIEGNDDRRNMSVIIQDRGGNDMARYNLREAWPSGYSVGKLDSLSSGTAIEELVIQYERLEREA